MAQSAAQKTAGVSYAKKDAHFLRFLANLHSVLRQSISKYLKGEYWGIQPIMYCTRTPDVSMAAFKGTPPMSHSQ